MTKREKIIVVVMTLTVIYGVYELLLSKQFKKSKQAPAQVTSTASVAGASQISVADRKLVDELSTVLKEDETAVANAYVADRVDEPWKDDPFSTARNVAGGGGESSVTMIDETKLIYNGYVDMGATKLAIINGADYRVGDELDIGGYRVRKIAETGVILVSERMGTELRIPFVEEK
ncbi:MAG: hypothetical protein JXR85_01090 [Deltaproteobacteria bacterium]|nr:hypothetical protein [Deltaproteobacteria bacterium]